MADEHLALAAEGTTGSDSAQRSGDRLRYGAFILDIGGNNFESVCQRPSSRHLGR